MLKVGLIGVGGISAAHISAWKSLEDAKLVALCDIREEQMAKYPDVHHYCNFEDMLENEALDVVDICLPTYLHADYSIKAMERGIHVICEKPISLNAEDVARVYSAAHKNQVKFMVAQVLRFWPEYELLKVIYDSQKYGKLLSASFTRLSSTPKWSWDNWMKDESRSGLVPFDLHIHDLDFIISTFGKPTNMCKHRSKRPEQDYFHIVYEYDGFFISAQSSWFASQYPFTAGYCAQFEKAVVAYENGSCKIFEDNGKVIDMESASEEDTGSINLPKSDAYANEIRYFADCVLSNTFPEKVKPEELTAVIELLHKV